MLESIVLEPHAYTPTLTTHVLHKGLPKPLLLTRKRLGEFLIFYTYTSFAFFLHIRTNWRYLLTYAMFLVSLAMLKIFICFAVSRGNLGWDLLSP